ncbi:MAG: hypothetical protein JSS09_01185 [Verrucomicrobia bacterium]|nr:hypothetical protein [Verrucomicrobiota bacterium]
MYGHNSVSFYYLKNNKQITSIDELRMVYADHIFLLIGREPGSFPYNIKTWGKSCVVCDA